MNASTGMSVCHPSSVLGARTRAKAIPSQPAKGGLRRGISRASPWLVCGIVARAVHDVDRYRDARRAPGRPGLRGDRLPLRPARRRPGAGGRTKPSHLPGAVYASLDRDLSGAKTGSNGRHPLPDPQTLARTFGRLGIADGVQVVAYDQDNGMYASRLWWLLRWMGHGSVAVLDGGLARWIGENRPLQSGIETRAARRFEGFPQPGWTMTADETAEACRATPAGGSSTPGRPIAIAARTKRSIRSPDTSRAPSTISSNGTSATTARFRSPDEIRDRVRATIGGVSPDRVVCYCGSGVTACQNLLAFEHAGLSGAKLFPGIVE